MQKKEGFLQGVSRQENIVWKLLKHQVTKSENQSSS